MRKYASTQNYCPTCKQRIPADKPGPRKGTRRTTAQTVDAIRSMRLTGTTVETICHALHVGPNTVLKYAPTATYGRASKLRMVRDQIADGTYETDEKLGKAALKAVPDMLRLPEFPTVRK